MDDGDFGEEIRDGPENLAGDDDLGRCEFERIPMVEQKSKVVYLGESCQFS